MKILVTGGAGYIGSHTTLALLKTGYDVVVLDNFSNSSKLSLERVAKLAGKAPNVVENDILDDSAMRSLFDSHSDISAVIHFAALKAVGESGEHPIRYYENNVAGSIVLLREMERAGVNNLVFSSSCTVYGEPKEVPIDESHPIGKVSSPYGRTKSMMEEIIIDSSRANSNFKSVLLRYFNPVGADKSGQIGEDPNGIPDNLVPFVCQESKLCCQTLCCPQVKKRFSRLESEIAFSHASSTAFIIFFVQHQQEFGNQVWH